MAFVGLLHLLATLQHFVEGLSGAAAVSLGFVNCEPDYPVHELPERYLSVGAVDVQYLEFQRWILLESLAILL